MTDQSPSAPDTDRLTGLVFELASQLHAERAQRIALQHVLIAQGIITPGAIEDQAKTQETRAQTLASLDQATARLIRILTESPDPKVPLRAEAGHIIKGT
jgi:hypothetical protein